MTQKKAIIFVELTILICTVLRDLTTIPPYILTGTIAGLAYYFIKKIEVR